MNTVAYAFLVSQAIIKKSLRGFSSKSKLSRWFLVCILLESFIKFPVDPYNYYEPLYILQVPKNQENSYLYF